VPRIENPFADELLPEFDVEAQHALDIAAPTAVVYAKARELEMSGSVLIRGLFRLRGLPASALNAEGLRRLRFKPLRDQPPRGFVLGIIGQFWTPKGRLVDFDPEAFTDFDERGYAKAIWSFDLTSTSGEATRLRTLTRIQTLDPDSRRRFRLYWAVIGPFSAMIRMRVLRLVESAAIAETQR
jgi:hypothetical protein